MTFRRIAPTNPRRELAQVTVALQHALSQQRPSGPDEHFDPSALATQVRVAALRARAAQLRRLIALGPARPWRPEAKAGDLPFPPMAVGE